MARSPVRTRRLRAGLFTVLLAAVVVGVVAVGGLAGAARERIRSYDVDVVVADDGTAVVRETIDYDFGPNQRHGIFRDIPVASPDDQVRNVRVRSLSAPEDVAITNPVSGLHIRIGDPNRTITGRHRYAIDYTLPGVVEAAPAPDREAPLAIDLIGTEWPVGIDDIDIEVRAPFELDRVRCVTGVAFSTEPCSVDVDGGTLRIHTDHLDAGEGHTLFAEPAGTLRAPEPLGDPVLIDGDATWFLRAIARVAAGAVAAFVVGALVIHAWARRAGRDRAWSGAGGPADAAFGAPDGSEAPISEREADRQVTIQFAPPRDLTPAQGGALLTEGVTDDHRTAWLAAEAIQGWFDIDDNSENDSTTLVWKGGDRWSEAPVPLQRIFTKRSEVELRKYDRSFAEGWSQIGRELRHWRDNCGLWDHQRELRLRSIQVAIGVAGLVGLLVLGVAAVRYLEAGLGVGLAVVGGGLAGAGAAAVTAGRELPVRTAAGFGLRQQVEGFRRFLAESEGYHAREAAKRGVLRDYSAWAVALGELDRWNRAVDAAALAPTTPGVVDGIIYAHLFSHALIATTPPSSSGGGGGGGVFSGGGFSGGGGVGGGAGGGGGGSW